MIRGIAIACAVLASIGYAALFAMGLQPLWDATESGFLVAVYMVGGLVVGWLVWFGVATGIMRLCGERP